VDVGRGHGDVTLDEAVQFLSADLVRLKRMDFFAKDFFARVAQEGAETTFFQVSNGFLIKIYRDDAGPQNEAEDGVAENIIPPLLLSVYLVEPRRASSAVLKFSGTLGMHNRFDRRSASVMAFSHFVVESSACKYMFADIQGSMDRNILMRNESALTLFDPMTHTPRRKSGLGDHGIQGFKDFIECHKCTSICTAMNLCPMSDLTATLPDDELDSSDEQ